MAEIVISQSITGLSTTLFLFAVCKHTSAHTIDEQVAQVQTFIQSIAVCIDLQRFD